MNRTKHSNAKTETQAQPAPDAQLTAYTDWIARAVTHPDTPPAIADALKSVIVNVAESASGYIWSEDEEGLRFMLPRLFFGMSEDYANGLLHSMSEMIEAALPEAARRQTGSKFKARGRDDFAYHFAEALRIARTSEHLSGSGLYNSLSEAWSDFLSAMPSLLEFHELSEVIRIAFAENAVQQARAEKGGASR